MSTQWDYFKQAARLGEPEQIPVALIVDSPWLPGYAGLDTRDYFLFPEKWLEVNLGLLKRFPEVVCDSWILGGVWHGRRTICLWCLGCTFIPTDRPPWSHW